jgi:hypothetical protein
MSVMTGATKETSFRGEKLTLRKLSLRKYILFSDCLASIPETGIFDRMKGKEPEDVFKGVVAALRVVPEKLAELVAIGTDVPKDQVLDADLEQIVDLLIEIWQFNNFVELFKKKIPILTGQAPDQQIQEPPSTGTSQS